jgi:leader peptidase (prepilin peptidase) / N-methyltransferase
VTWFLGPGLAAAAFGAVTGAFVPAVIARVPEPAPEPAADGSGDVNDIAPAADEADYFRPVDVAKEPYAEVARLPGLRWKCALAGGVAAAFVGARLGWHPALLFLLYLVPVCVALSVVDWRTRYLPTRVIAPSYVVVAVLAVVASALTSDWAALRFAVIGWLGTFAFFWVVWFLVPRAWSYGDVRLSGVLGMALGWAGPGPLFVGVWTGFFLGGVGGLLLSRMRVFHRDHVPLGPFLALGAWVGVVWSTQIGTAYASWVGGAGG